MDMKTPNALNALAPARTSGRLNDLAAVLGCSTDLFFEAPDGPSVGHTAQLLQMWLAIRAPEDRRAVFACVQEILKAQAHDSARR
ncbi:hypothetical protein MKK65_07040 [Methylobacterium sp. J-001]|jgi:hypothetical protein|uniref:hypothetical protein n=1 Tax=Methylobacterium sp. J-001 TaxID=2836609 RepID=UPI001FB8FA82|nr:hypothetical protein [Methylobacterium sp. J-001]MCJ2116333.1 hypothetical protein [Methylobacterium sp. J-001]